MGTQSTSLTPSEMPRERKTIKPFPRKGQRPSANASASIQTPIFAPAVCQKDSSQTQLGASNVVNGRSVTPWTVPPRKRSPRTAHGRIISPPDQISQPYLVPPAADGPPGCRHRLRPFCNCNASATTLAYGDTPRHCLLDQNKVRQHLIKSAGGGDDTTPIEEESA